MLSYVMKVQRIVADDWGAQLDAAETLLHLQGADVLEPTAKLAADFLEAIGRLQRGVPMVFRSAKW